MNANTKSESIAIEVSTPLQKIIIGNPFPIKVTIKNTGQSELLVNKRLGVGYRDSDSREIFLEIKDGNSNTIISQPTEDYERGTAASDDYGWLKPGASIHKEFDLFEWYELPNTPNDIEDYSMTVFYQADESYEEEVPEKVIKGIFASPEIKLTLEH